ncbi:MAG: hypothetical protein H7831_16240 [Magnetococcus sp. WYHC-3]
MDEKEIKDFTEYPEDFRFEVGMLVVVQGFKMRVRKVTNKDLVLRPVTDAGKVALDSEERFDDWPED